MPTFKIELQKQQSKRTAPATIKTQLTEMATRGCAGKRSVWIFTEIQGYENPESSDSGVLYKASIVFKRKKSADADVLDGESEEVADFVQKSGNSMNWQVVSKTKDWQSTKTDEVVDADGDFVNFDRALTFNEIEIPELLLYGEDHEIESHPAFSRIYGRAAHIRSMAGAMYTMLQTEGQRRNHHTLWGLPGCGKSSLFKCWHEILPKGSYINLNANSSTRAGLEYIFVNRLKDIGIPPFTFVEEMEKTQEAVSTTWLSILDDRAEVRKVTHGKLRYAEVRTLVFSTVNDKLLFDRIMGGRPGHPGALSSRMTGLYVPRPDASVMRRILARDIQLYYPSAGKDAELWVEACIELADAVKTNDPRKIVTFLDGRHRLLTGEYQRDIMRIHELEVEDKKSSEFSIDVEQF